MEKQDIHIASNVVVVSLENLEKLHNTMINSFNTLILKMQVVEAKLDKLEVTK